MALDTEVGNCLLLLCAKARNANVLTLDTSAIVKNNRRHKQEVKSLPITKTQLLFSVVNTISITENKTKKTISNIKLMTQTKKPSRRHR